MSEGGGLFSWLKNAFADRVDARIDQALQGFAEQADARNHRALEEAVRRLEGKLAELTHLSQRIEANSQAAARETETAGRETVAQAQRDMTQAMAYGFEVHSQLAAMNARSHAAHDAEAKAQMAGLEAKAYADAGIADISSSIAATGKSIGQASKRIGALEQTMIEIRLRLDRIEVKSRTRPQAQPTQKAAPSLQRTSTDVKTEVADAVAKTLRQIDDVIGQQKRRRADQDASVKKPMTK
ncbi:hypothetical protein [Sphingomonas sp. VDB2]|uniref:hypothetical protein n=1 Tax=Sphingomonas sp. VDB2 TaxID=3228751 RepID=UPI003A811AFA